MNALTDWSHTSRGDLAYRAITPIPKGEVMTEEQLQKIPEVNAILWQDDDGPTSVIDSQGVAWMIGTYQGNLCKRKHGIPSTRKESL